MTCARITVKNRAAKACAVSSTWGWPLRPGFTMIELVSAMAGASVLLVGLAVAMLLTARSLEDAATPNTRIEFINTIADRIADDARHATTIQQVGQSIAMTLPDRDGDGLDESVAYSASNVGLQRTQSLHPAVTFLSTSPSLAMRVDGYTSPTQTTPASPLRLLGWTQAATTSRAPSLSVEMPSSTRSGDLLVLITAGDEEYVGPVFSGWSAVEFYENDDLFISVFTRTATTTELASQTVYVYSFDNSSIAATSLCFSGDGRSAFDDYISTSSGYANPATGSGIPGPLEIASIPEHAMNLQILAIEDSPLTADSSGLAGFSDVSIATSSHSGTDTITLVTALRNGKLSSPVASKFGLQSAAPWIQVAMQWWP